MATLTIDVNDLPSRLNEALDLARAGTEVILQDANGPVVKMVPIPPSEPRRPIILNMHPGAMVPSADFDDPLPEEFWLGERS
jgi:antitoxin (DNA-binding transcriptional repressor) of toxin-antitoxin stability system